MEVEVDEDRDAFLVCSEDEEGREREEEQRWGNALFEGKEGRRV
jgi:hypothetical protein